MCYFFGQPSNVFDVYTTNVCNKKKKKEKNKEYKIIKYFLY